MDIKINRDSSTPLYTQIKKNIRDKILSGELPDGFKLPSERYMADKLSVHRNTVVKSYESLISEGLVISSRQKPCGYFVERKHEMPKEPKNLVSFSSLDKNFYYNFINMQNRFEKLYHASYQTEHIPFAAVVTNPEALPVEYLKEIMGEIIKDEDIEPFWCCDPQGTKRLRSSLAEMLFSRHIYVKSHNIQIVSETYEAISNIAFMYLNKGDYVIIEEPACPAIANIFLHVGAKLLSVPIEENGIKMDILEEYALQYKPKLIYTMPNYQNPSTHTMDAEKRKQLLNCAILYNIPIIEDDSEYDYCYKDTRLPSLYSMDTSNSVIYLDTAGLSVYPGIRLAYMIAPDNVLKTYRSIVNKDQLFLNSMGQYLWMRFLEKGFYTKHLRFIKEFYCGKRELMCGELSRIPGISFQKPEGGLVVWVKMEHHINDFQVAALCEKMGLLVMPGSIFFPEGNKGDNYLRISFSSATDEQIVRGTKVLNKAISLCRKNRIYEF